jgi:cytochrome c oxidase assembly protein subunit 15
MSVFLRRFATTFRCHPVAIRRGSPKDLNHWVHSIFPVHLLAPIQIPTSALLFSPAKLCNRFRRFEKAVPHRLLYNPVFGMGPVDMNRSYHPFVHRYAIFIVCWTIVLLTAGALVTSEDAALAVPDWPLSYGTITPPMVGGIAYEHTHRLIAAGLGLLTIGLAALLWRTDDRPWMRWLAIAALGGVVLQGVLGGLTVIKLLHYWLPVMHACTAQLMFALLVSIAVFTSRWWTESLPQHQDKGSPSVHTVVTINAAVIFLQVLVGAGFRHQYISLRPHIIGAPIVFGVVIWTAAILRRRFSQVREISRARILLHAIVGTQILLGLIALWSRISTADAPQPMPLMVASTVVHTVVGAILFAISIVTVLVCYRLVPRRGEVAVGTAREQVAAQ